MVLRTIHAGMRSTDARWSAIRAAIPWDGYRASSKTTHSIPLCSGSRAPKGSGKCPKSKLRRQIGMNLPEPIAEAQLRHFLCHRQGHFDEDMHAWLQQIAGNDARAILIGAETGQLPPLLQLALHCASQTLKDEIANQPGFALQFLERAAPAFDSLRSRYPQAWVADLMGLARSAVARYVADSVLAELIKP